MKTATIKIEGSGSAVYLLKHKGEIIYVGQSKNVMKRFAGHQIKYDEVEIIWTPTQSLLRREGEFIRKHHPRLNLMLKKERDSILFRLNGNVKCTFPLCKNPARLRGLCNTHYATAAQQVHRGKTTWKKLELVGKVQSGKKRGRKSIVSNYFSGELLD